MRVAAYIRVSSEEQARSGAGLAAQEAAITQAVEQRGDELVAVFADEGQSGKSLERPQLYAALDMIAHGAADCLMVSKLDRLTRSTLDFALILDWFRCADAAFVALDLAVDTTTPGGKLVAAIFAVVAEWERDVISQRTRDALQALRAAGRPSGRPSIPEDLRERCRLLREEGLSMQRIADRLNSQRVPTARGGREWYASTVRSALRLPTRPARRKTVALPKAQRP